MVCGEESLWNCSSLPTVESQLFKVNRSGTTLSVENSKYQNACGKTKKCEVKWIKQSKYSAVSTFFWSRLLGLTLLLYQHKGHAPVFVTSRSMLQPHVCSIVDHSLLAEIVCSAVSSQSGSHTNHMTHYSLSQFQKSRWCIRFCFALLLLCVCFYKARIFGKLVVLRLKLLSLDCIVFQQWDSHTLSTTIIITSMLVKILWIYNK